MSLTGMKTMTERESGMQFVDDGLRTVLVLIALLTAALAMLLAFWLFLEGQFLWGIGSCILSGILAVCLPAVAVITYDKLRKRQ